MNPIKKFAYSQPETFTYNGSEYIGYYNIKNNIPYLGKYKQEEELGNISNAFNIVTRSDLFFNRLSTENKTLTYSLSDFVFQPGEIINGNSLDSKLQKAFINYLDTYVACFMVSSDLPYDMVGMVALSSIGSNLQFKWRGTNANVTLSALSSFNPSFSRNSKIAYASSDYNSSNTLIVANSANLVVYSLNYETSTFNLVFSSGYIETSEPSNGSLTFKNISSITKYESNLYISDIGNKFVYSYDMSGVLNGDRALGYKFNLKDSVNQTQGGFLSPQLVAASDSTVYVYDSGTYTIFYYDTSFNLKNSYKNEILFSSSTPVSLTYYKLYDQLYVLTSDFKLLILDNEANVKIIQLSTQYLNANEVGKKIIFSNSNSDIMYLMTNMNLYKKFISNVVGNIGDYTFSTPVTGLSSLNIQNVLYDIDTIDNDKPYDDIILYGYDQFINYHEKTVFNSIIK